MIKNIRKIKFLKRPFSSELNSLEISEFKMQIKNTGRKEHKEKDKRFQWDI